MLPDLGLLFIEDAETGRIMAVDSSSVRVRSEYKRTQQTRRAGRDRDLHRYGVSPIEVRTDAKDYAAPLINYFRIRARRA